MKLKLFIFFLIISAGVQAQIHMRIHQKDATVIGIPIADIDSVTNVAGTKTIRYKDASFDNLLINTIDSITHAVSVTNNLYNVISGDATLSQFKTGVDVGGLNPYPYALSGNLTAFVPTNTVFTNYGISTATLSAATNNYVISYHTLNKKYNTADFPIGENIKYFTANVPVDSVFITKTASNVYVNGARIDATASNISASNGLAHKMTDFLFPPGDNIYTEINKAGRGYDSIAKLVARAAIADPTIVNTLQSTVLTLLAPSNAAFASFLSGSGIGAINNLTTSGALNLLKDHMVINRKFLINLILAGATGSASYGESTVKVAQAPTGVTSPTGLVVFYTSTAAVVLNDFDYMQSNGVIQKLGGILTK
jgi:uncharacterized surface protein with fasciclin (FAS1) repeats